MKFSTPGKTLLMSRQTGIFPMKGKLAGVSHYYDRRNGAIARTPGGPTKLQIKTKKTLAPVRKNNTEFGRASSSGKLIRHAFKSLVDLCKDTTMTSRMVSLLQTVIKADTAHRHGNRVINETNLRLFKNFDLGTKKKANYYFYGPAAFTKNRKELNVEVKILLPDKTITRKATHWRVTSVLAGIDFGKEEYRVNEKVTTFIPVKDGDQLITLSHTLPARGFLFHGMCINFFEEVRGRYEIEYNQNLRAGYVGYAG